MVLSQTFVFVGLLTAASVAAVLLVINHSWIMTKTELIRIDYGIATAPEDASQGEGYHPSCTNVVRSIALKAP